MPFVSRPFLPALALCAGLAASLAFGQSSVAAQEKVSFPSTDGDLRGGTPTMLTGFLYRPEGPGPFPAVVVLHGCGGLFAPNGRLYWVSAQWGDILSREGYVVLMPDSHGPRGAGDLCATLPGNRPAETDRERPRDAYGALAFLQSRPDVRGDKVAVLGQSAGAETIFWAIARSTRPAGVSPERDFRAAVAFYPNCPPFLSREAGSDWAPRLPLLFLMGEADNFASAPLCKLLLARAAEAGGAPIEAHFYPGAHHAFDAPNVPLRVLTHVKVPPDGHSPTVGTNSEARADAIARVERFLTTYLKQ